MKNIRVAVLFLALVTGCQRHLSLAPDLSALAQVRTVYLGDFGAGEGSDLVKEKLRLRLLSSPRFVLVETAEKADAVLTGSAGIDKSTNKGNDQLSGRRPSQASSDNHSANDLGTRIRARLLLVLQCQQSRSRPNGRSIAQGFRGWSLTPSRPS